MRINLYDSIIQNTRTRWSIMKKMTAFLFSIITLFAGILIGYSFQEDMNTNILLSLLMVGNALLIVSTVKSQ